MYIKFEERRAVSCSNDPQEGYELVTGFAPSDAYHLRKDENGAIYVDETAKLIFMARVSAGHLAREMTNWFDTFYRTQVEQAQRAARLSLVWEGAFDGTRSYQTLTELDEEAAAKQEKIRALRSSLESADEG